MTGRTLLRRGWVLGIWALGGMALLAACANPSARKSKAPTAPSGVPAASSGGVSSGGVSSGEVPSPAGTTTTDTGSRFLREDPVGAVSVETPPLGSDGSRVGGTTTVPAASPGRPWIPPPPPPPGPPGR